MAPTKEIVNTLWEREREEKEKIRERKNQPLQGIYHEIKKKQPSHRSSDLYINRIPNPKKH